MCKSVTLALSTRFLEFSLTSDTWEVSLGSPLRAEAFRVDGALQPSQQDQCRCARRVNTRGPKDHTRILHPGSRAQGRGIPEAIVHVILMFM